MACRHMHCGIPLAARRCAQLAGCRIHLQKRELALRRQFQVKHIQVWASAVHLVLRSLVYIGVHVCLSGAGLHAVGLLFVVEGSI